MNLKREFWALAWLIAVFGVFCVCMPILVWKHSIPAPELIQLASVILSWPVAVLLVALMFIARFEPSIRSFLENIRSMKLPAGVEIQSQPPSSKIAESEEHPVGSVMISPEQKTAVAGFIENLVEQQKVSQLQHKEMEELYQKAVGRSMAWKFRYLDLFFVPNTKKALYWFNTPPAHTRESYDIVWSFVISDKANRDAIFDALLETGMILDSSGVISVTPEGAVFVLWLKQSDASNGAG